MTTTAPGTVGLRLRLEMEIRYTVDVDLATYYNAFTPRQQAEYAAFDVEDYGGEAEWDRPVTYPYSIANDMAVVDLVGAGVSNQCTDTENLDYRVRYGEHGADRGWAPADYRALCAVVPWLAARQAALDEPVDPTLAHPHLSRLPGPYDAPLIGDV